MFIMLIIYHIQQRNIAESARGDIRTQTLSSLDDVPTMM